MAEFCEECFEKLIGNEKPVLISDYKELCEGCGQVKEIVIEVK